ncbi:hypothetical protein ACFO0N_13810 [Halobium salinum]|uniref:Uncharacterized protein n=1 Tax=Halobium salinum TaxID=1364940 RepID=A0ABD5PEE3_9EURY|nr:hypothetical protein [Halobium salinum]
MTCSADGAEFRLSLGREEHTLSRAGAVALRDALGDALTRRETYFRTVGEHREDGSYVVSRRGADSAGHSKVFRSFEELERLYERLPATFTANEVGRSGLTGGRRHMLVRHLAEHPAFDCGLTSQQPLTARKRGSNSEGKPATPSSAEADPAEADD